MKETVEIVRCKDCGYISMTTIGMPYACWREVEKVDVIEGKRISRCIARRVEPDDFCNYGIEREEYHVFG